MIIYFYAGYPAGGLVSSSDIFHGTAVKEVAYFEFLHSGDSKVAERVEPQGWIRARAGSSG